jgi:hypothetical protein
MIGITILGIANYGYAIIESLVSFALLLVLLFFIINFSFEEKSVRRPYRFSSLITTSIVFGIIIGIRCLFETLGMWMIIFRILNNDMLYFSIMVTIFFFLYKPFLRKFGFSRVSNEEESQYRSFNKIILALILISWILAGIFLSMRLLGIELRDPSFPEYPDKFSLGVFWSFAVVLICIILTSIINRTLSNEKRIEKKILRSSMYGGGFIAFGLWFIQLVIFEIYIHKWLGFQIIIQDIRVLFVVVVGLIICLKVNCYQKVVKKVQRE